MTQEEFARGWKLLIIQPFGKKYNQVVENERGEMVLTEDSKTQLEFYFDKLKHGTAGAWMKTAQQYAMGESWPTVLELRTTMRHHESPGRRLTHQPDRAMVPMPDEMKALVVKIFGAPRRTLGPFIDESVPEESDVLPHE